MMMTKFDTSGDIFDEGGGCIYHTTGHRASRSSSSSSSSGPSLSGVYREGRGSSSGVY